MNNSLTAVPSKHGFDACLVDRDGIAVAHVCSARDVPLFTAAPELLEALVRLVGEELGGDAHPPRNDTESYRPVITWADRAFARAAIAKARGNPA